MFLMHIGFFTDGYVPQLHGVATSLEAVSAALEKLGHTVSIFAPKMGDYVDRRSFVYRFASWQITHKPPLWLGTPFSLRAYIEIPKLRLDIVHTHAPFPMHWLGVQVARRGQLPLINTYHTILPAFVQTARSLTGIPFPVWLARWYSRWTCNMCNRIVAPSEKTRMFLEGLGVQSPVTMISNGVNVERFQNRARGYLRTWCNLLPDDQILLCVGRLTPEKNVGFLIDALAHVIKRNDRVYLLGIGEGPDRARLLERAKQHGIEKHVMFPGVSTPDKMPDIYADADIYVSGSFSEAHSMAALEALASGLPMVVVRDQSFEGVVCDGENGFMVAPEAAAFAARLNNILDHPTRRAQMRVNSQRLAAPFSVDAQARKLVDLYREVQSEREK